MAGINERPEDIVFRRRGSRALLGGDAKHATAVLAKDRGQRPFPPRASQQQPHRKTQSPMPAANHGKCFLNMIFTIGHAILAHLMESGSMSNPMQNRMPLLLLACPPSPRGFVSSKCRHNATVRVWFAPARCNQTGHDEETDFGVPEVREGFHSMQVLHTDPP